MADFYENLAVIAARLLADKGQTVTFSRDNVSSFDPVLGQETLGTPVTYSGDGASFGYNKSEVDGTIIQAGDIRFILEAVTTEPLPGDSVTIDSVVYRVMDVRKSAPAGTVTHYELQLRK